MTFEQVQLLAGSVSSVIFMSGTLSMLVKTWHTHDVDSYSLTSLLLNNAGNLVYWIYVFSLPFGPVYFLHGFYTVATVLMLVWYFIYRQNPQFEEDIKEHVRHITQTMEFPVVRLNRTSETERRTEKRPGSADGALFYVESAPII